MITNLELISHFNHIIIVTSIIIIFGVPEGFNEIYLIFNGYFIEKMRKQNILVKTLNDTEILGSVNDICIDKMEIITLGNMEVSAFYIEGKDIRLNHILLLCL